jgi:general secretion pathway protein G
MKMRRGFTLIELLIVTAVIAVLVGIALPRFKGVRNEGDIARVKGELRTLQTAVESFSIHNNQSYPAALTDLNTVTTRPGIVTTLPDDPFAPAGTSYQYVRGGKDSKFYIIYSVGPEANGTASIVADSRVSETNNPIYVSNMSADASP